MEGPATLKLKLSSGVVGRSGKENSPCAASADVNMGVAAAQMIEPDPKPAPTDGKSSFGVHVPGGLGIQGKTVVLLINYLLSYVICNNMDLPP